MAYAGSSKQRFDLLDFSGAIMVDHDNVLDGSISDTQSNHTRRENSTRFAFAFHNKQDWDRARCQLHTQPIMIQTPSKAPNLVALAIEITGLSVYALAQYSGIPQTTLQRAQSSNAPPKTDTIAKMTASMHRWCTENGAQERKRIWDKAVLNIVGLEDSVLDEDLLHHVIVTARHELRYVIDTLPAERLADAILTAYHDMKGRTDDRSESDLPTT